MPWSGTSTPRARQRDTARDAAILATAKRCQANNQPFPQTRRLALTFGTHPSSLLRSVARLEREQRLTLRRATQKRAGCKGSWVRCWVERVA